MNEIQHRSGALDPRRTQVDYILLDGSSSMLGDPWWEALMAIDAYVAEVKSSNVQSRILLATFDQSDRDCVQRDQPISDWKPLLTDPVGSNGGLTPLYDAVELMGRRLRDLDPPRASIVIVTDGEENASRSADLTRAKAILDWMRAKGWQVTFIGANFDNSKQSELLGGSKQSAIGVQMKHLADATKALAAKRARYALYGTPMHYTDEEHQQFGGFLSDNRKAE